MVGRSGKVLVGGGVGWDCSWGGEVGSGGFHGGMTTSGEAYIFFGTWCGFLSVRRFLV